MKRRDMRPGMQWVEYDRLHTIRRLVAVGRESYFDEDMNRWYPYHGYAAGTEEDPDADSEVSEVRHRT